MIIYFNYKPKVFFQFSNDITTKFKIKKVFHLVGTYLNFYDSFGSKLTFFFIIHVNVFIYIYDPDLFVMFLYNVAIASGFV